MEIYLLRLFADDGVTLAAEFSTDPEHERPYLLVPEQLAGQNINLGEGRASIGSMRFEVTDSEGYMTALLPAANGYSARIGRRAQMLFKNGGPSFENVISGVIDDLALHDALSSFTGTIKDERENERRTMAFVETTSCALVPRGVIDGFGLNTDGTTFGLLAPTTPLVATYEEEVVDVMGYSHTFARLAFATPAKDKEGRYQPAAAQVVNETQRAALDVITSDHAARSAYDRVRILWRAVGVSEWTVITRPLWWAFNAAPTILGGVYVLSEGETDVAWLSAFQWEKDGQTHPANGAQVEVIIGFIGPPSEDYPFHYEGVFGELLANMMDGSYSDGGAVAEYDADAVAALNELCLARILEPLDDDDGIWKWVEKDIYAPLGAAPALDADGAISPVRYALPDAEEELIQLDDTNCELLAGWEHTGSDAVNVVSVTYQRLYAVAAENDPLGKLVKGDGLAARKITVEHRNADAFMGERPLKIEADTLCCIGGTDGESLTGDVADEFGAQLAARRTRDATDRFLLGGQHFTVRALREDTGIVRPGQWCVVACSWMPEYSTGARGANRLAQVVRVVPLDSTAYELELIDAGPDNQPVSQPTLDAESAEVLADGSVSFDVTAIPSGVEAAIHYTVSELLPGANDGEWRFSAPRMAAPGTHIIPPSPAGGTIWIRGRGEAEGQRPSAWTVPFSVDITPTPRVRTARVTLDRRGIPTVTYTPNDYAGGVRIYYSVHLARIAPSFALYADFAASGSNVLGVTVLPGQILDVRIDAYEGYAAGAVTGAKGDSAYARVASRPNAASNGLAKFGIRKRTATTEFVGGIPGALVADVFVYDKLYEMPGPGEETITPDVLPSDVPTTVLDPSDADADGFVLYEAAKTEIGFERYVFMIPIDGDGNEGTTYVAKISSLIAESPFFDNWKQSNASLLLTDVYGRANDPGNQGGTLYVWSQGSDFTGDADGELEIDADDMPLSFGPGTVFEGLIGGLLLNDLPVPPGKTGHIALSFVTTDSRTTGQVLVTLHDSLEDMVDEFGGLRVESWRAALTLAAELEQPGVGEVLPPDGTDYSRWYIPSTNTLYEWTGSFPTDPAGEWVILEGTDYMTIGSLIVGRAVFGAISAEAIQAGAINAKLIGAYKIIADNINIGALSLIADDLGAIIHGVLHNAGDTAGINLDAAGAEPVFYHDKLELRADGDAIFSGELSAATGTFEGALSAATGTFEGDITAATAMLHGNAHLAQKLFFDWADEYGIPGDEAASIYAGQNGDGDEMLTLTAGADGLLTIEPTTGLAGSVPPYVTVPNLRIGAKIVSYGAADSGGTGFKLLRVAN